MTFENIFSSKPEKPENKTPIIIDTREKQSLILSILREKKVNVKLETLEVADYLIGDIAIERKTFSDFISSMINKRLFDQLEALKKYPNYFLIIESFNFDYPEKMKNAIKGMLLSVALNYKIPLIFTKNEEDTAEFLILTAKKIDKPKQELSLRPSMPQLSPKEQKQYILEGFPEIGPVTAKKLLEEFGSIKNIINAPEEKLKEVLGIKFEGFKQLLN